MQTKKRDSTDADCCGRDSGTGPTGLVNTVPSAMMEGRGAIVYGHGAFAANKDTFQKPFNMLMQIEENSFREYFRTVKAYLSISPTVILTASARAARLYPPEHENDRR